MAGGVFRSLSCKDGRRLETNKFRCDVIESRSGAEGHKGLSHGCTYRDRKRGEARERRIRQRESSAGKSLKVVNSFEDGRVKRDDRFVLTLMEVSEVNGCSSGSTRGAEGSKEGLLKGVPVVMIDAAAFECVKPEEGVAAEGIKNEGHSLVGGPGRGSTGMRDSFDPLLGRILVFNVA